MTEHDATEQAFKNGYSAGYVAGRRTVLGGDVTAVIRCKNCKYARAKGTICIKKVKSSGVRSVDSVHPNFYCADGKRRLDK